jgi:hypothetical protein
MTVKSTNGTAEKPTGGVKVLSGDILKMGVFLEKNLIQHLIENRIELAKIDFNAVMISGYTLYDIPAEGGFSYLDAKAGNVCAVWKTCEPKYIVPPDTWRSAVAGSTSTVIRLDAGASSEVDFYVGMVFVGTSGVNNGLYNICTSYDKDTKYATFTKVWPGGAPAAGDTFTVGGSDVLAAADVTGRANPTFIFGIKLGNNNTIEKINLQVQIQYSGDINYLEKSIFYYCYWWAEIIGGMEEYIERTISNLKFYNSFVGATAFGLGRLKLDSFTIKNCTACKYSVQITFENPDMIDNVEFGAKNNATGKKFIFNADTTIKNCKFYGITSYEFPIDFTGNNNNIRFENVYFDVEYPIWVRFYTMKTDNPSVIYCNTGTRFQGTIENYIIKVSSNGDGFIGNALKLDYDLLDFNNFIDLTADFDVEYRADSALLGLGGDMVNYTLRFKDEEVPDELKYFGPGYVNVVQREDYEDELLTNQKYIRNYLLYSDAGCSAQYLFQADENILILAEDESANKAVFCWFGNNLYPTVLSDVWDDRVYTITRVFQIWRQISKENIQNVFSDENTKRGISNSPMTGEVKFKSIDYEILFY